MTVLNAFFTEHLDRLSDGYARLALLGDEAKAHAWSSAKELARRDATIYGDLPDRVAARVKEARNARG